MSPPDIAHARENDDVFVLVMLVLVAGADAVFSEGLAFATAAALALALANVAHEGIVQGAMTLQLLKSDDEGKLAATTAFALGMVLLGN
ncbi:MULTISPECIES: hypothetical protein [Phyllobacteriaceae]|jgi:hypothetical protein|uniref:hypothetical protein n=1 Tax=Phyllobacteriaceae TaxID=69277 RepID=UPI002095A540|nr:MULTISPECIES: hypothetical protein [Phyllobacteriaceae]MCO6392507.1 hypothetical protein [Aliihoeflea aestuarii]MCR5860322.1 hypothetical protein [Mesorhizobium sp. J428]